MSTRLNRPAGPPGRAMETERQAGFAAARPQGAAEGQAAGGGWQQPPGGEPPGYPYGAYAAIGAEAPGGSGVLDLRNILSILRRRKFLILGLIALAAIGASLYVSRLTPLYQASAVVVVEPDRTKVLDVDAVVRDLPGDLLTVQTEAAKIGSRTVALGAIERLNLLQDPGFNPNLAPPAPAEQGFSFGGLLQDLLALVGLAEPRAAAPAQAPVAITDEALLRETIAGRFMGGLSVNVGERSRLITISYVSTDPQFAARAANAVAIAYIEGQVAAIGGETTRAASVVQEKLTQLEAELSEARRKLEAYRAEHGLTDVNGSTLQTTQLASLNGDLIAARNRQTEAEVRYEQVKRMLDGGGGSAETAAAVVESSMVQSLRSQEIEISREISELSTRYRDGHPKMIEARARLKEIQSKLWSEVRKVGALLKNELEIARGQVANLEAAIEGLKGEVASLSEFQVQLSALQADVEAKSKQYDAMLARYNEISVQEGANDKPDAELITQAQPPGAPFSPRSNIIVGMATLAAAILGLVLAMGLEFLDSGFRSLSQIEAQTGQPTLGMVPMITFKNGRNGGGLPHHFATARHGSIFAEAVRTVRTNLLLSNAERPPRVVLVTSSMPNEGKTTTVLSIASQTVQTGRRCIVVDCDMRQASVDESLGHPNHLGLSDFLANAADLTQIIGVDERTGVHFIGAGTQANPPVELLGSARMKNLINALAQSYHLVVLDTPPLLAVSDALVLLREADATVFLIRWAKTPRDTAKLGLKTALEAGARLAGVVLSYVDVKKHAQYTYADSGHYYNKAYRKYYYTK